MLAFDNFLDVFKKFYTDVLFSSFLMLSVEAALGFRLFCYGYNVTAHCCNVTAHCYNVQRIARMTIVIQKIYVHPKVSFVSTIVDQQK